MSFTLSKNDLSDAVGFGVKLLESFKELYNYSKDKKSAGNQQYKILTQN